jgi:Rod binding domain-containing protein
MIQLDPQRAPPPAIATTSTPRQGADAAATATAFEAVFLGQMAQAMLGSVESDSGFSGGHGEEIFRGILAEQLGTAMAARGGIGLAPAVMDQIIKLQEGQADVD